MPGPSFTSTVRSLLRERLLAAAAELTCADGWAAVTMGKVAAKVGVSRQTVYKELGAKPQLAEALMLRETDEFVAGVANVLAEHSEDAVEGITAALRYTLEAAADNPLFKTVLSGPYGGHGDLLPLLTNESGPVLARAVDAVTPMLVRGYPDVPLTAREWSIATEAFVRLLLSHLVQPTTAVDRAVEQMRWVVARTLRG
jgi:AcrR family transcriptional regulator